MPEPTGREAAVDDRQFTNSEGERRWVLANALEDYRELVQEQAEDYGYQDRPEEEAVALSYAATAGSLLDALVAGHLHLAGECACPTCGSEMTCSRCEETG